METTLIEFLRSNTDVFMWKPSNMPSIPHGITKHHLNIRTNAKPMQQRLRCFDKEKRKAISKELARPLAAGFIKEV